MELADCLASRLDAGNARLIVDVTLPGHPPSINAIYRNVPGVGRVKTAAADEWISANGFPMWNAWRAQGAVHVEAGRHMLLLVHFTGFSWRSDIDGPLKILQDTLVRIVAPDNDDRYVTGVVLTRNEAFVGGPMTAVALYALEGQSRVRPRTCKIKSFLTLP